MKQNMLQLKSIVICSLVMLLVGFSFEAKATTISDVQQTVSGTVTTAADGMPLPGVTVVVKGTSNGTTTDFDGNYELEVAADAVLTFSYVGMKTIEIPVDGQSTINATLEEDMGVLDEIVVVGYGSQKRSDVTGSVSSVPEERLENLPVTNVTQAIQGTTAGLNISQGSSVPGSSGSIQVRGINSITGSTSTGVHIPGHIVQTVNNIGYSTRTVSTSTSYTDVGGHTVTITPKFAGSKIMICSNFADTFVASGDAGNSLYLKFVRSINGGTFSNICYISDRQGINSSSSEFMCSMSYSWLDVPSYSVGNAIVYKAQMKSYNTNSVVVGQQSSGSQMMYAMEIAQ